MTRRLRAFALTAHVACSVGWLGAVAAFLALSLVALTSGDVQTVRGAYVVMHPTASAVLVPLSFASLVTGVAQSLATPWGLFRHYWVVFKLAINAFAAAMLLFYMDTFRTMARVAADPGVEVSAVRNASPAVHAVLALLLLLVATALAVYKPRGLTPYGARKQREERAASSPRATPIAGESSRPQRLSPTNPRPGAAPGGPRGRPSRATPRR